MFLKHLINPKPSTIIFFVFFCIIFACIPLFQYDINSVYQNTKINSFLILIISIALPFLISMGLNNMIYEKNILKKENLLISFIFILISCAFTNNIEVWTTTFLLLFLFNNLLKSYQKELPFSQFYNASLILAVISFIFPNTICLILLLIINGINYSNLNLRIGTTIFLGFITPYLFYFIFSFLLNSSITMPDFFNFQNAEFSSINMWHHSKKIWIIILICISLLSFLELFTWLYKKSMKSRRTFMTIIWFFIICFITSLYSTSEYFYFMFLPLSIILGNYFVYTKNRLIANILFLLLVISSIYYKYMIGFNV